MMKIAFFSIHPAPYRDPFLNRLSKRSGVDLEVFTFFKIDQGHDFWQLPPPDYKNTQMRPLMKRPYFLRFHWAMLKLVLFGHFDLMVFPGFLIHATTTGMLLCWLFKKNYVYTCDSVASEETRNCVTNVVKLFLIRRASFIFVPGVASKNFLKGQYGIKEENLCCGSYAMNNEELQHDISQYKTNSFAIRKEFGLSENAVVFLMVANMIQSRHYPITAAGFLEMAKKHSDVVFVMVGKGDDYPLVDKMSGDNPRLLCVPGCSFEEMKRLYAMADVYVHGGSEPASTALAIGAISGLPLLSSYAVGQAMDCLVDGVSGVVVKDYKSATDWESSFCRIMELKEQWPAMGHAAQREISFLDIDACVEMFYEKALSVC